MSHRSKIENSYMWYWFWKNASLPPESKSFKIRPCKCPTSTGTVRTLDWKHSQYQKTVQDMRLPPPSNLLISGLEIIEKQIFYPCPFLKLADLWFSYAKLEAKWCIRWQFSPFKLSQFVQKYYQLILKDINSYQRLHKYLIFQFNSEL